MLYADAAFITGLDFFGIIFKSTQRRIFTFKYHHAVSEKTHILTAFHFAICYITAGNIAHLGNLEDFANLSCAQDAFLKCGSHQSDDRIFNIFNNVINNIVKAHIHIFFVGQ